MKTFAQVRGWNRSCGQSLPVPSACRNQVVSGMLVACLCPDRAGKDGGREMTFRGDGNGSRVLPYYESAYRWGARCIPRQRNKKRKTMPPTNHHPPNIQAFSTRPMKRSVRLLMVTIPFSYRRLKWFFSPFLEIPSFLVHVNHSRKE